MGGGVKSWKGKEVSLTQWLSGTGLWQAVRKSRALRGERVEDIEWGPISVELKTRKVVPKYILTWMKQALTNSEGRFPIIILHQDGMRMGHQVVMLELEFFVDLMKGVRDASRHVGETTGDGLEG